MSERPLSENDRDFVDGPEAYPDIRDKSGDKKIESILAPVRKSERRKQSGSREHLHLVLDALIDLRELNAGHGYALDLARSIVAHTMEWAAEGPTLTKRLKNRFGRTPDPDRPYDPGAIAEVLTLWPLVMPHDMHVHLIQAFSDLQHSTRPLNPLFRAKLSPTNAALVQDAEERMLRWIAYQRGLGRTSDWGVRQVADAVGLTESAVRKWREKWSERSGPEAVKAALATARHLGRETGSGDRERKFIAKAAAEGDAQEPGVQHQEGEKIGAKVCVLVELFSDESGLCTADATMFQRYEEEGTAFREDPEEPLKTLVRVWKRSKAMPPHDESGPVRRQ